MKTFGEVLAVFGLSLLFCCAAVLISSLVFFCAFLVILLYYQIGFLGTIIGVIFVIGIILYLVSDWIDRSYGHV